MGVQPWPQYCGCQPFHVPFHMHSILFHILHFMLHHFKSISSAIMQVIVSYNYTGHMMFASKGQNKVQYKFVGEALETLTRYTWSLNKKVVIQKTWLHELQQNVQHLNVSCHFKKAKIAQTFGTFVMHAHSIFTNELERWLLWQVKGVRSIPDHM